MGAMKRDFGHLQTGGYGANSCLLYTSIVETLDCILNSSRNPSYTGLMSIVANLAGIAKGMSITFREIFEPKMCIRDRVKRGLLYPVRCR